MKIETNARGAARPHRFKGATSAAGQYRADGPKDVAVREFRKHGGDGTAGVLAGDDAPERQCFAVGERDGQILVQREERVATGLEDILGIDRASHWPIVGASQSLSQGSPFIHSGPIIRSKGTTS
jgi:hypothetical protein